MVLLSFVAVGPGSSLQRRSLVSQEPGPGAQPDQVMHEQEKTVAPEQRAEARKALAEQEKAQKESNRKAIAKANEDARRIAQHDRKEAEDAERGAERAKKSGDEERKRRLRAPAKELFDRVWFKKPWKPLPKMPWAKKP